MIADISEALEKLLFSNHTISPFTSESFSNGEATRIYGTNYTLLCGVIPLTGKELKNLPEGQYTSEDVIILTKGDSSLTIKDRVTKNGSIYEVMMIFDISEYVNVKKFIGKKMP